jgi:hypothetical protein
MSEKAPMLYIDKHLRRSIKAYIALNKYINSNKRVTKRELNRLLQELKTPLFLASDGLNPSEEIIESRGKYGAT